MKRITLYTGGGVSLSPVYADGRTESAYVRLVADDGKALQKGAVIVQSIDILPADVANWAEIDEPDPEEETTAEEILDILLGGGVE